MLPLLTMKLLADEKKSGTMELLLTYPVRDAEVVLGKFLACLTVFAAMLLSTISFPLLLIYLGNAGNSADDNRVCRVVSARRGVHFVGHLHVVTDREPDHRRLAFGRHSLLLLADELFNECSFRPGIGQIISYLAINEHLESLAKGVVDTEDIIYFLVFTVLFLFLTLRSLESKRWR